MSSYQDDDVFIELPVIQDRSIKDKEAVELGKYINTILIIKLNTR